MAEQADIDGLAGEYVLGSLTPDERAAVAGRLASDARLAAAVAEWEWRLGPLSLRAPEAEPPARVLPLLLAEIAQSRAAVRPGDNVVTLQRQVRRWQFAAASLAAGLGLLLIALPLLWLEPFRGAPAPQVAVLAQNPGNPTADERGRGQEQTPVFVVALDRRQGSVSVRQVSGRRPAAGRVHVLWLEPAGGAAPVALGALAAGDDPTRLALGSLSLDGSGTGRLLVSVEAASPAAWERPRGPLVSAGSFER